MAMKETGTRIPIPNEGTVPARLARIIEVGVHSHPQYKDKDQVVFMYSLPTRIIEEEGDYFGKQSMIRTQPMTNSTSNKAALYKHRLVLDGAETTSFRELLNAPCYLTIIHNEVEGKGTFANISSVSGVPEGLEVGELDTTPFYFDFDSPDADVWTTNLWDGIREKIQSAVNYPGSRVEEMVLRLEAMEAE